MKKTSKILMWVLSGFMLLSAVVYMPSLASGLMLLFAVIAAPIAPLQELFARNKVKGPVKGVVLAVLFLICAALAPTDRTDSSADRNAPLVPTAEQSSASPSRSIFDESEPAGPESDTEEPPAQTPGESELPDEEPAKPSGPSESSEPPEELPTSQTPAPSVSPAPSSETPGPSSGAAASPGPEPSPYESPSPALEPSASQTPSQTPSPEPAPSSGEAAAPVQLPSQEPGPAETPAQSQPAGNGGGGNGNADNFNTWNVPEQQQTSATWVLNTNTKKIHYPSCSEVKKIKPTNYSTSDLSESQLISQGYTVCKRCH